MDPPLCSCLCLKWVYQLLLLISILKVGQCRIYRQHTDELHHGGYFIGLCVAIYLDIVEYTQSFVVQWKQPDKGDNPQLKTLD